MISTILLLALLSILTLGTPPAHAGVIFVNPGDAGTTAGHPAKPWTETEKAIVNEALSEWKTFIENFDQVLGTWTLRWEDADLFKRFGEVGAPNDLLDIPGVTVPQGGWAAGQYPSPPKNSPDFPEGEIYFNTLLQWFLDPTPATDDAGEPPALTIDFLTAAKHEIGHALGIVEHLPNRGGGVMEKTIRLGERHRVGAFDILLFRQRVPEPSTVLLTACGFLTLGALAWRRHARSAQG